MTTSSAPRRHRSLLFVPGLRPKLFAKAIEAGADIVCVDLEDAVAAARKDEARTLSLPLFAGGPHPRVERALRVNNIRTPEGLRDLQEVIALADPPDTLVLPKVRDASEVQIIDELLANNPHPIGLQVIIETNDGLLNAAEIAAASPRVQALFIGTVDLSAELRIKRTWQALLYARSRVVHAAARAGVDVLDVPFLDLTDPEGLRAEAESSAEIGFTGKAAIHPDQLPIIHATFTPSAEEVARAKSIIEAFRTSTDGLLVIDGKLIEKPVLREMQRILANAGS
ncbi:MAG TPA: CoA ester lyase [Candidatus Dormibacteraeota bacterium]|nr:CoA ester lyase [Candidatus Dormibacteraeota bacterium]